MQQLLKNLTPLKSCITLSSPLSVCQDKNSEAEESTRRAVSMAERISGEGTIFAARAMLCLADVLGSMPGESFPLLQQLGGTYLYLTYDQPV